MKEYLMYPIKNVNVKENETRLKELNELINQINVNIEIQKNEYGELLTIEYDPEEVKNKLTRGAGRKRAECLANMTVEEVRERMDKGESAEMIASELGISRSTFFRKLKYAEEQEDMFLY